MSNANALATVTAALAGVLAKVASDAVGGSRVHIGRPDRRNERTQAAINIFLYQVSVNPHWRNADAPTRDSRGRLVQRPAIALDLNYMLTFYGQGFVPQVLLGHTVSGLHAHPFLSRSGLKNKLSDSESLQGETLLSESDLEQTEMIRLSPVHFTLDELSRLWSVFFQIPYDLSIAYQASVVLIEAADEAPQPALPVLTPQLAARAGGIPQIEQIVPQFVEPPEAAIRIMGRGLTGRGARVLMGDPPIATTPEAAGADLLARLGNLPAGVIRVRVDAGNGLLSNAGAFVYRPRIEEIAYEAAQGEAPAQIVVRLEPPMARGQTGFLILNAQADAMDAPGHREARALPLAPRQEMPGAAAALPKGMKPGVYLVRAQVDGAESALILPAPPAGSPEAARQTVTIP